MSRRGRSKSIALVVAAVIAVAPLVGLNVLLWLHINANGIQQIDAAAAEILAQVDERLDTAMTALIGLGVKDVKTCGHDSRNKIDQAAASTPFTREFAIMDSEHTVLCSNSGRMRVVRAVSARHETLYPQITFDLVDYGGAHSARLVRLVWTHDDGSLIRVMIAGKELIPPIIVGKLQSDFLARLMLADGTLVAARLTHQNLDVAESTPNAFEAYASSERYPVSVRISVPRVAMWQTYRDLFIYGNAGGLLMSSIIMLVAWGGIRRLEGPEREITDAIRNNEFICYYQPVIDLTTGRLVGCEALVRRRKSDGTIIPPSAFIPLAESSGKIYDITRQVLRKGREDLDAAYADRPHLKVSFNLVAGHFDSFDILDDVKAIFSGSKIRMSQMVFEVTERQELPNIARARVVIARLQELGTQVALDDVGTGHGGLSYLLKLGVDQMKIDKMFVDAIGTDRYSTAIIDSLVRLASEMSMDLVAEGVETTEQIEYLRQKGVRSAQGYVFAPPLPAKSYLALVEAMSPLKQGASPNHRSATQAA